jgi:YidC/Oxa1 family membrane protein insertase
MDPLYKAFGWLLALFYAAIPNLGVAIILLTILVMLILFPLTAKQAKSMLAMQRVQPEIKRLQAKYKNDRQKLNEEMMKFYKENQINPLAGCLPLVVQLPVFFALYRALRSPYKYVPLDSKLFDAFCHPVKTVAACKNLPGGVHHLKFLSMDLSLKPTDVHGFTTALPYYVLVGLVILTGYLQSRQTSRNQPAGGSAQMAMVGKIMPVFFGVICLEFPAGLALYFFVSNLWRVGQQELIMRKIAHPDKLPPLKTALPADEVIEVEPGSTRTRAGGFLERLMNPQGDAKNGKGDGKPEGKGTGTTGNGKSSDGAPKPSAAKTPGNRQPQSQQRRRNKKRRR